VRADDGRIVKRRWYRGVTVDAMKRRDPIRWWRCPVPNCSYRMRDDGSASAAARMSRHFESHDAPEVDAERENKSEEKEDRCDDDE
jgi:hypothetical protein